MTAEKPEVSILLPVWNAAATLGSCLRSIARQTARDFECVIVDDGSEDASREIVRAFARSDSRFLLYPRPHRGLITSLQEGIECCRGEVILRMDADDLMHRHRIAAQTEMLGAHPQLAAVGSHVRLFPRSALGDGYREYEGWLNAIDDEAKLETEAFVECPVAHPGLAIRRRVLEKFGYRDCGWPEDYDLVLRLLAARERIGVVPRRLLLWRHTRERLSQHGAHYAIDRFVACKAHYLAQGFLDRHETYILWGYGSTGRDLQRALAALGKRPAYIVELHPGRLGQTIQGARVIPPRALAEHASLPVVASVAGLTARTEIRETLDRLGRREGRDYVCAA